jgi:acyl-coenzyme A synthetase/AMP-(fatty) acid ligase
MEPENLYQILLEAGSKSPEAKAILSVDKVLSFRELTKEVAGIASGLIEAGVEPGERVATSLPGHWDWPVTLALSKIGAVSVSVPHNSDFLNGLISWQITDESRTPGDLIDGAKALVLDKSWTIRETSQAQLNDFRLFDDLDPFRLFLTSGTTGNPKLASYSFGAIKTKAQVLASYWHQDDLEFNFMPIGSIGGFSTALASVVKQVPFITQSAVLSGTLALLARNKVGTLTGSPYQIASALRSLEAHQLEIPTLRRIRLAGSFPSVALRDQIATLGVEQIESVYGSTECGAVFVRDLRDGLPPEYLGEILPGCQVRALQNGHQAHGLISETEFEYKTPSMFDGYLLPTGELDPGTVDGWYKPGDRVRHASGKYLFVGRDDDLVNIGGVIFSALPVEEFARSFPGVEDALSFATEDAKGSPLYALAVVAEFGFQLERLSKAIEKEFKENNPSHLFLVLEIPKNQMGKPLRFELERNFKKRLAASGS